MNFTHDDIKTIIEVMKFFSGNSSTDLLTSSLESALKRWQTKGSKSATVALQMAVNDTLTATMQLNANQISALDTKLSGADLPSLTQFRRKHMKKVDQIINLNIINNDEEYFIAKSIIEDTNLVKQKDRSKILRLIADYERT
jgi:hypothetical protein